MTVWRQYHVTLLAIILTGDRVQAYALDPFWFKLNVTFLSSCLGRLGDDDGESCRLLEGLPLFGQSGL